MPDDAMIPASTSATSFAAQAATHPPEMSITLGAGTPLKGWPSAPLVDTSSLAFTASGYTPALLDRSPASEQGPGVAINGVPINAAPLNNPPAKLEPSKKLSVAIPRGLHKTLKQIALDEDVTMGELITDLLRTALKQSHSHAAS